MIYAKNLLVGFAGPVIYGVRFVVASLRVFASAPAAVSESANLDFRLSWIGLLPYVLGALIFAAACLWTYRKLSKSNENQSGLLIYVKSLSVGFAALVIYGALFVVVLLWVFDS